MTWFEKIRDRDTFAAIYRTHHPVVFRFALSMTGDRAAAADVTQDVFVWLIHHPGSFDPARGELSSFLLGVTRKFLLRRGRSERRLVPLDESVHLLTPVMPRPEEVQAGVEAMRAAVAALPPRYREVVILCDLEGLTYEEVAAAVGCATGTVKSRLHRARQLLGRKLERNRQSQGCAV